MLESPVPHERVVAPEPSPAGAAPVAQVEAAAPSAEPAAAQKSPVAAQEAPAPTGTTELAVEGFLPAFVAWPQARRWPQPTLVAAHGAGDYAESHCELWRHLLAERGIVLCLRGRAIGKVSEERGYYFPDHFSLRREALAAISALEQHHAGLADTERLVYAGYSQGAQMGLLMLLDRGAVAPRLLLIEGGSGDWSPRSASMFAHSGGERVAIVCGTPGCQQRAEVAATRLKAVGVAAMVHYVPGGGHTYLGSMVPEVAAAFAELTQGDTRWEAPAPP